MAGQAVNLRGVRRIILRRKWTIVVCMVVAIISAGWWYRPADPVYRADSIVTVPEPPPGGPSGSGRDFSGIDFSTAVDAINEDGFMRAVVARLAMLPASLSSTQILPRRSRRYCVRAQRSGLTGLRFLATADRPESAVALANTAAQVYVEDQVRKQNQQAFREQEQLARQLQYLDQRILEKQRRLTGWEQQRAEDAAPDGPLQVKAAEVRLELAGLLQKYTEKHPLVIQLRQLLARLESYQPPAAEAAALVPLREGIESDRAVRERLTQQLAQWRRVATDSGGAAGAVITAAVTAVPQFPPSRLFVMLLAALAGLLSGAGAAAVWEWGDPSLRTVEAVENFLELPVLAVIPAMGGRSVLRPRPPGSLGSVADCSVMSGKRSEKLLRERSRRLLVHFSPLSPAADAYRGAYSRLKPDSARKTVLITSAVSGEGKSMLVSNLGLCAAQAGLKTLIVSADIRRPVLSRAFGVVPEPGLTDFLLGTVCLERAVRNITDYLLGELSMREVMQTPGLDNLWLLPCGQVPFNPGSFLASRELHGVPLT